MTTPQQLANRIERSIRRLQDHLSDLQEATTARLLRYRRTIVHVDTGELRESLAAFCPFSIGQGILESRVVAPVKQGIFEELRGGHHASGQRTVTERQSDIERLADRGARATAAAAEGR